MDVLTIDELYRELAKERKKGNGSKKILVSDDEEGNGFHPCFFGVTPMSEDLIAYAHIYGVSEDDDINDFVVVG